MEGKYAEGLEMSRDGGAQRTPEERRELTLHQRISAIQPSIPLTTQATPKSVY